MSLMAKQNTEPIFFQSFIKRAEKGEQAYIDIVKPIILDASEWANKRKTVIQLDRKALTVKLWLIRWPMIKKVTDDNLYLPELLSFIEKDHAQFLIFNHPTG